MGYVDCGRPGGMVLDVLCCAVYGDWCVRASKQASGGGATIAEVGGRAWGGGTGRMSWVCARMKKRFRCLLEELRVESLNALVIAAVVGKMTQEVDLLARTRHCHELPRPRDWHWHWHSFALLALSPRRQIP